MGLDAHEADRLVEATRRIFAVDAETQSRVTLSNAGLDEVDEKPTTNPLVPTRHDYRDRQFRDILGDEAVAVDRLGIGPIPGCTHRPVLFGNESVVAFPRPSSEVHRVARIGEHLVGGRCRLVGTPDRGLAKHRRQKREVLRGGRATPNVCHLAQSSSNLQAGWSRDHGSSPDQIQTEPLPGVDVRHVRRLVHEKRVLYIKCGHLLRFDPDDIATWIDTFRRHPGTW